MNAPYRKGSVCLCLTINRKFFQLVAFEIHLGNLKFKNSSLEMTKLRSVLKLGLTVLLEIEKPEARKLNSTKQKQFHYHASSPERAMWLMDASLKVP
jgi:hypothetical protein